MKSKVRSLQDVVWEIPDRGAEIALGGFAITRCPIAFINELIRQNKREITLYEIIGSLDADILVGAGAVKKLSYAGGSLDKFGRLGRVNEGIEKGTLEIREYSGLSMTLRFLAGFLGIPFIPTKTLLGTEVLKNLIEKESDSVMVGTSPFHEEEKYVFLGGLQPDYAVIHCQYADEKGNVVMQGPMWDLELAKSAKKLIVTVEKIVTTETIKRNPEYVQIPSVYPFAICEVPFGAYPTSVYKVYDYDAEAITRYAGVNMRQESFDAWLQEFVLGTRDHNEFIAKMAGVTKLAALKADPVFGYAKGGNNHGDE